MNKMKMRRTIVFITALYFSVSLHAQNGFEPVTYFGIKLGGNTSGIISDPIIIQKINTGVTGGVVFKHFSDKRLGVQIELNYKQSGWNENLDSTNTYQRRLDYIELPFMTHLSLGNQKTGFVINLGPYVSYLLSEKEKINLLEEVEEKDYYGLKTNNKAGFGLCLGFGLSQHTTIGLFQAEIRISSSLTDVFKSTTAVPFSSSKILNAELSISYMLDYSLFR
jgi:hypothetical protein